MTRREMLDNAIKQNLHNEVEWMWIQYKNSGYPERPGYNFRDFCENVGYKMLAVRDRGNGYGEAPGRVPHYGNFVAR